MTKQILGWVVIVVIFALTTSAYAIEVKPTGRIYANFNYNLSGYPDWDSRHKNNDYAEFALARAYLGVKAKITDSWSAVVVGDVARPTYTEVEPVYDETTGDLVDVEVTEEEGPYTYYVKYAYGQYQPYEPVGFRFGIMPTPYIDRYEKAWGYRYVEKTPSDRVKWDSSADAGLALLGNLSKYGSYYAMVRNGEGYKHPENDSGKAAHFRLLLTPFQMSAATRNLQLTTAFRYERNQRQDPKITSMMANSLLSYKYMFNDDWGINLGAGFDWMTTETDIDGDDAITGQIIHGYSVVYFPYNLALFARVDLYDPDLENDKDTHGYQDESTFLLAGISIDPVPEKVAFALDVKQTIFAEEVIDDNGDEVTKNPDTYLFLHGKFTF